VNSDVTISTLQSQKYGTKLRC